METQKLVPGLFLARGIHWWTPNCDIFNSLPPTVTSHGTKNPPKFGQMRVTFERGGLMR